jgi:hypothetical protein
MLKNIILDSLKCKTWFNEIKGDSSWFRRLLNYYGLHIFFINFIMNCHNEFISEEFLDKEYNDLVSNTEINFESEKEKYIRLIESIAYICKKYSVIDYSNDVEINIISEELSNLISKNVMLVVHTTLGFNNIFTNPEIIIQGKYHD